jgi:ADP-heptose:LPS heptosyltransferase
VVTAGHVLVARLDNLGDVLLAGPAVRAVAAGSSRVTLLCGPSGEGAARLLPGVDEVMVWDAPWVGFDPPAVVADDIALLVRRLRRLAVDQAAVLTSFHQSPLPLALLLRLAGVRRLAAVSVDYAGALLDERLADDPARHEVEQGLAVVAALGHRLPPGDDGALRLASDRFDPVELDLGDRYVVVHPAASVPARGLVPGSQDEVVDGLLEAGWPVVRTGVAGDVGRWPLAPRPGLCDLAGRTTLRQLAGVLRGAAALVCGNTGTAHLAAAVGTPVVWIFAPVVPARRWHPWRVPFELLGEESIACAGCRSRDCPVPGQPCLAPATPRAVVAAVGRLAGAAVGS